jgi:transglutaminase-like putative cysteine protease
VIPVRLFYELSLTGMLACGFAAIVSSGFLDLPAVAVGAAALILRLVQVAAGFDWTIPNGWVTGSTIAYLAFFWIDYQLLSKDFLAATVHMVIFLAVVKLFTARTSRDYSYLYVLAFLQIVAGAIVSANAAYFPALALFLLFAVATFSCAEIRRSATAADKGVRSASRAGWRLGWMSIWVTSGVLLLSGAMFFLLPRTAQAAFRHLVPERYHIQGFSNEVVLGRIGELKRRSTPILHVRSMDGTGALAGMRWRGAALSAFDGKRWFAPAEPGETLREEKGLIRLADNPQRWRQGQRLVYEAQLQMLASDILFVAGTPEFLQIRAPYVLRSPSGVLRTGFNTESGVRYVVYSFVEDPARPAPGESLSTESRIEHLILPPTDPRVIELARSIGSPQVMERYLRSNFRYSLDLPETPPADPIAYFLFERGEGHCEYFASALAVMLRAANIPSRVVTGFIGGVENPVSGWHVLRAADAHSWVEAWIEGAGWVTLDPTPPDPNAEAGGLSEKLSMWSDALATFWQDWVLDYSLDQQLSLATRLERVRFQIGTDWFPKLTQDAMRFAPWVLMAIVLARLARRWRWPKRRRTASEAAELYQTMLNVLERRGVKKPSWITAREFAGQLPPAPWRETALAITDAYYRLRFAGKREAAGEIRMLLKRL